MNSLPDEILLEIFDRATRVDPRTVLALSCTCSRMRAVVLDCAVVQCPYTRECIASMRRARALITALGPHVELCDVEPYVGLLHVVFHYAGTWYTFVAAVDTGEFSVTVDDREPKVTHTICDFARAIGKHNRVVAEIAKKVLKRFLRFRNNMYVHAVGYIHAISYTDGEFRN